MPTYRDDLHLGHRVPFHSVHGNTGEIPEGSITPDKLSGDILKMLVLEVELSDLDTLGLTDKKALEESTSGRKGSRYTVIDNGSVCGVLSLFSDTNSNFLTQVFTTRLALVDGKIGKDYDDANVHTYHRSYDIGEYPDGGWSDWKEIYGNYDELDNIPTLDDYELKGNMTHKDANIARYTDVERLLKEVFPLNITVTGGGVYKKGTSQTIQVSWAVREGKTPITPEKLTVNNEEVSPAEKYKVFFGVTTTTSYSVTATKGDITVRGVTTATFVNPSYFGVVSASFTPNADNVSALGETIKTGRSFSGTVTTNNQKVCYSYPLSMGALTSIKDASGYEYINSFTRSTLRINDEDYYVYVLTDASSVSNYKLTFN